MHYNRSNFQVQNCKLYWVEADLLHCGLNRFALTMDSWMKARVFALFWVIQALSFAIEATEATQQDSCTGSIKTLSAKVDKLQADIKSIAHGLGLLNPSGIVLYPSCVQVFLLPELILDCWQNR